MCWGVLKIITKKNTEEVDLKKVIHMEMVILDDNDKIICRDLSEKKEQIYGFKMEKVW